MSTLMWHTADSLYRDAAQASAETWLADKHKHNDSLDFTRREAEAWMVLAKCLSSIKADSFGRGERLSYEFWANQVRTVFAWLGTVEANPDDNPRRTANLQAIRKAIETFEEGRL